MLQTDGSTRMVERLHFYYGEDGRLLAETDGAGAVTKEYAYLDDLLVGVFTPGADASPDPTDTDSDGMPNTWETANGLNPNDPSDAAADLDNDYLSNLAEYEAGLNPQDADYDNDGVLDGIDAQPKFNPGALIPVLQHALD